MDGAWLRAFCRPRTQSMISSCRCSPLCYTESLQNFLSAIFKSLRHAVPCEIAARVHTQNRCVAMFFVLLMVILISRRFLNNAASFAFVGLPAFNSRTRHVSHLTSFDLSMRWNREIRRIKELCPGERKPGAVASHVHENLDMEHELPAPEMSMNRWTENGCTP